MANSYLIDDQPTDYEPLYRACYESFPDDPRPPSAWKVAWSHYCHRRATPATCCLNRSACSDADDSSAALYFLARLADVAGDPSSARRVLRRSPARVSQLFLCDLGAGTAGRTARVRHALAAGWPIAGAASSLKRAPGSRLRSNTASRIRINAPPARLWGLDDRAEGECAMPRRLRISRTSWGSR